MSDDDTPIQLADGGVQDVLQRLHDAEQRCKRLRELLAWLAKHTVISCACRNGYLCGRCRIERELQQ